jgi:hypothetical protein
MIKVPIKGRDELTNVLRQDHPVLALAIKTGELIDEDAEYLRKLILKLPNSAFDCNRYEWLQALCKHTNKYVERMGALGRVKCPDCGYENWG